MKKILALMFAALLATSSTSFAETVTFQATGIGCGPKGSTLKDSFSKIYARQAARLDALRNLAALAADIKKETFDSVMTVETVEELQIVDSSISVHGNSTGLKKVWQVGDAEFTQNDDYDCVVCRVTMETTLEK